MDPKVQEEIRLAAQRITGNNVFNSADAAKVELDKLGALIAARMDCILSVAPVKSRKRAQEKVDKPKPGQEKGDWLGILKDYARITLCPRADTDFAVVQVGNLIRTLMSNEHIYGYAFVKDEQAIADKDPCGYSGFNFVLRFGTLTGNPAHAAEVVDMVALGMGLPGGTRARSSAGATPPPMRSSSGPLPTQGLQTRHMEGDQRLGEQIDLASLGKIRFDHIGRYGEIQVNTMPLLYAKASKEDFFNLFGSEKYMACQSLYGVEGGLGHVLYEHYRSPIGDPRSVRAAALSKRYYARMRGFDRKPFKPADDTLVAEMKDYVDRYGNHA